MFWKRTAWQFVFALMGGLFLWAAYLNLNDADGWMWVIGYLVVAILSFLAAAGRPLPRVAGRLLFFSVAGSIWLGIAAASPKATPMFEHEERTGWKIVDTEEGREAGGLSLISFTLFGIVRRWPLLRNSDEVVETENVADKDE